MAREAADWHAGSWARWVGVVTSIATRSRFNGAFDTLSNKSNNTVQKQPLTGYVLSDRCAASPIRARKAPPNQQQGWSEQ